VAEPVTGCDCAGEAEFAAVYDSTEAVADVDGLPVSRGDRV